MDRKLLDYLPPVLREVLEFQAINEANGPETALAWDALDLVMANQFLEDADARGVSVWEKELGIFPKDTDSLESRKAHIKAIWNLELPYTGPWLKNWLANICGPAGHREAISDYTIDIQLDYAALPDADRLAEEILKMLLVIRPANMRVLMTALLQSHGAFTYGAFSEFSSQVEIWPRDTRDIVVQADPAGGGTATGGGTFNKGALATVIANSEKMYEFVGWRQDGGIVSTDESYTFTVEEDCILTAVFVRLYTIGTGVDPEGGGLAEGSGVYREGTSVTVTATEGDGYRFAAWMKDGEVISESRSYTFSVEEDRILMAVFIRCYTISVSADPESGGTATGGGTYNEGESVAVTAKESSGYTFVAWQENGAPVSADLNYTFTATENRELTAVFEFIPRLPVGYTEVEYIQTDRYCGFNTGIMPNLSTTRLTMDLELDDYVSSSEYIFVSGVSANRYLYCVRANGATMRYRFNTSVVVSQSLSLAQKRVTISLNCPDKTLSIEDDTFSISGADYTMTDSLYLFKYHTSVNIYSPIAKLYSAQMYEGDTQIRDFVPCTDPDGTVGLYDLVEGVFYQNAWTGTLTAGPAV